MPSRTIGDAYATWGSLARCEPDHLEARAAVISARCGQTVASLPCRLESRDIRLPEQRHHGPGEVQPPVRALIVVEDPVFDELVDRSLRAGVAH